MIAQRSAAPTWNDDEPFKATLEKERREAIKLDMVRRALGLMPILRDVIDAFPMIRRAEVAVGIYPDPEADDGYGLIVIKGGTFDDEIAKVDLGFRKWVAIPCGAYEIAEAMRRIVAEPGG